MTETKGQVTIRLISKQDKIDALQHETVRIFSVSSWILSLLLAPIFIALAFFSAFFFLAFFPLFIFTGAMLSLWVGWQFWKLRRSDRSESLEGEYAVTNDTRIVETKTDDAENK